MDRMLWTKRSSLHFGSALIYALNALLRYAEGTYHHNYNFENERNMSFFSGNFFYQTIRIISYQFTIVLSGSLNETDTFPHMARNGFMNWYRDVKGHLNVLKKTYWPECDWGDCWWSQIITVIQNRAAHWVQAWLAKTPLRYTFTLWPDNHPC